MKPLNQWLTVFKGFSSKIRALENRRLGTVNIHIATCVTQRQTKLQALLLIPVFGSHYVRCASMCGCEHVWMCACVNVYMHV